MFIFFRTPVRIFADWQKKTAFNWPENIQTPNQEVVLVEDMKDASYKVLGSIALRCHVNDSASWKPELHDSFLTIFNSGNIWKPLLVDTSLFNILFQDSETMHVKLRNDLPISSLMYQTAYFLGKNTAPDYKTANCTELLTKLLSVHYNLTPAQKKQINVVIPGTTATQIIGDLKAGKDKPAYGGVCHFVEANNYGNRIHYWEDVLPGDLVQWWWFAGNSGHCGIVKEVNKKDRWFSVYSSTPGQGFGVTRYPIDFDAHFYFARITAIQKTP